MTNPLELARKFDVLAKQEERRKIAFWLREQMISGNWSAQAAAALGHAAFMIERGDHESSVSEERKGTAIQSEDGS